MFTHRFQKLSAALGRRGTLIVLFLLALGLYGLAGCSDESSSSLLRPESPGSAGAEPQSVSESAAKVAQPPLDLDTQPSAEAQEVASPEEPGDSGRTLTMYVTDCLQYGTHWQNLRGLRGAPGPNDNQNVNAFAYNDVMSSAQRLWAYWFNYPTLQPGERITEVYVDVNARYDAGTSANTVRMYVGYFDAAGAYHEVARDTPTWTQHSTDDNFRWRMGGSGWNITNLHSSWTMGDVVDLWVGARRFPNNDPVGSSRARFNAYRIIITTSIG